MTNFCPNKRKEENHFSLVSMFKITMKISSCKLLMFNKNINESYHISLERKLTYMFVMSMSEYCKRSMLKCRWKSTRLV